MYDDVLVPTDGSEGVESAIEHGIDLAAETDATVHALFVVDTADATAVPDAEWAAMEESLERVGHRAVNEVARRARQRDVDAETAIVSGTPHEEIVGYAEGEEMDLIVMGTHGRSGIERVLLGSVTAKVVRQSEVPVLVKRIDDVE